MNASAWSLSLSAISASRCAAGGRPCPPLSNNRCSTGQRTTSAPSNCLTPTSRQSSTSSLGQIGHFRIGLPHNADQRQVEQIRLVHRGIDEHRATECLVAKPVADHGPEPLEDRLARVDPDRLVLLLRSDERSGSSAAWPGRFPACEASGSTAPLVVGRNEKQPSRSPSIWMPTSGAAFSTKWRT